MTHLTDADLVRHLDAEGDAPERASRDAHLGTCAECDRRARALGRQSTAISDWLDRTMPVRASAPEPARVQAAVTALRHRSGRFPAASAWLRAAAIVLLVAAPLAAFPPVRAWVAERVGLASPGTAPAAMPAEAPAVAEGPVIRFVPTPGAFSVRLDGERPGGTLAIARASGPEAVLRGAGGAGEPPPIVADDGIRIPGSGTASEYRLRVPAITTDVVVILPGSTLRVSGAAIDRGQIIELGGR